MDLYQREKQAGVIEDIDNRPSYPQGVVHILRGEVRGGCPWTGLTLHLARVFPSAATYQAHRTDWREGHYQVLKNGKKKELLWPCDRKLIRMADL